MLEEGCTAQTTLCSPRMDVITMTQEGLALRSSRGHKTHFITETVTENFKQESKRYFFLCYSGLAIAPSGKMGFHVLQLGITVDLHLVYNRNCSVA